MTRTDAGLIAGTIIVALGIVTLCVALAIQRSATETVVFQMSTMRVSASETIRVPSPSRIVASAPAAAPLPPQALRRRELDNAVKEQAEAARVIIKLEKTMRVGEPQIVQLLVQHGDGMQAAVLAGARDAVFDESVPVSYEASAGAAPLTANIEVKPAAAFKETQVISNTAATIWTWTVTPLDEGEARLLITLKHKIAFGGRDIDVPVRNFPQTMQITIEPWMRFQLWLASTNTLLAGISTLIATLIGLFGYLRWRKKEAGPG